MSHAVGAFSFIESAWQAKVINNNAVITWWTDASALKISTNQNLPLQWAGKVRACRNWKKLNCVQNKGRLYALKANKRLWRRLLTRRNRTPNKTALCPKAVGKVRFRLSCSIWPKKGTIFAQMVIPWCFDKRIYDVIDNRLVHKVA